MVTILSIVTTKVGVELVVVMKEGCFTAFRTRRVVLSRKPK